MYMMHNAFQELYKSLLSKNSPLMMTRHSLWAMDQIVFRVFLKSFFTFTGAEIIYFSFINSFIGSLRRIYVHSTDRIFGHITYQ